MPEITVHNYTMNFGPQHPAAHGVMRLVLELDGEMVERADPHIGLLHRGTEKLIEYRPYLHSVGYFDRLDYVSIMYQEHAYVLAVESLLGIEIPERARHSRAVRRNRPDAQPHLECDHDGARHRRHDADALGFEEREKLMEFYERVSGARMHADYFRAGGVHREMPAGLADDMAAWAKAFPKVLEDIERMLNDNRIFRQRTVDIGVVEPRGRAGSAASPGRCCAPRACPGICARASPTRSTTGWTSTSRSAGMATASTATWCAWRRCANP